MRFLPVVFMLFGLANFAYAGQDVFNLEVEYVYQQSFDDSTTFEFAVKNRSHSCGSNLYRSRSPSDSIAQRKFSLILAAFTSGKKVSINETGACEGSRMVVEWVRITH